MNPEQSGLRKVSSLVAFLLILGVGIISTVGDWGWTSLARAQYDSPNPSEYIEHEPAPVVNLDIYNGQGGAKVDDAKEVTVGAFTVANLNDTNGNGVADVNDNEVKATANGRDEVDLMKLVIDKPNPDKRR